MGKARAGLPHSQRALCSHAFFFFALLTSDSCLRRPWPWVALPDLGPCFGWMCSLACLSVAELLLSAFMLYMLSHIDAALHLISIAGDKRAVQPCPWGYLCQ